MGREPALTPRQDADLRDREGWKSAIGGLRQQCEHPRMKKCTVAMLGGLVLGLAGLSNGNAQTAVAPATSNQWTILQSKHDLPPEALAALVRALVNSRIETSPFKSAMPLWGKGCR